MKKNICLIISILILSCLFNLKQVTAVNYYSNLIDVNQILYNVDSDVFYSNQEIKLTANTTYTFVASENFFGTAAEATRGLHNKLLGISALKVNGDALSISFKLKLTTSRLYYATTTITEDCFITFTDFLTKGYNEVSLPKDEFILYKGTKEDFQGFRKPDYLENYYRVENTFDIYTNCENPIKLADIKKRIKWYDNEIGFQDDVVIVENNYVDNPEVGEYFIKFEAVDDSSNKSTLTVNVKVVDIFAPAIIGPDYIEWDCYTADAGPENVLKYYTAFDNVDGDITDKLMTETFIMGIFQHGVKRDYEFVLWVADKAGNETRRTIIIRSRDLLPPELVVKDLNVNLSELGESAFSDLFPKTIEKVSDYSGSYLLDYECIEEVGKMGFSGIFKLKVIAADSEGNKTEKISTIKVIDDIAPEFYLYIDLINTTVDRPYTLEEIKELISEDLYNNGILYDSVNLISCDYISNEDKPGKYQVKYAYNYKGETNFVVGSIIVAEEEKEKSPTIFYIIGGLIVVVSIGYAAKKRKELY